MSEKSFISRKEQARLTKKKIFDTTMLLIKKKGYGKITIREICQSAQISIGTFYLYFSSKDEILLEIYDKIDQKVRFPSPDEKLSPEELICQDFRVYLSDMVSMYDKELLREIYRNSLISGENRFLSEGSPLFTAITELLSSFNEQRLIPADLSASALCRKCHIFVQSYIFQWLVDDNLGTAYLTEECIQDLKAYLSLYIKNVPPATSA